MWDTTQYLRFGDEQARSRCALVSNRPGCVVDMGCCPGNPTVTLAKWWLSATVVGVDSSPEITVAAGSIATDHAPGLSFMRDDIRHWKPQSMPDVVDSYAVAKHSA